jgi:hypothetical protein
MKAFQGSVCSPRPPSRITVRETFFKEHSQDHHVVMGIWAGVGRPIYINVRFIWKIIYVREICSGGKEK